MNEPGEAAVRNYKSKEVTIILAVDADRERISLYQAAGFRPFHHLRVDQRQGAIVTGKVKTVDAKAPKSIREDIIGYLVCQRNQP
jgi:ribosomal protein S1